MKVNLLRKVRTLHSQRYSQNAKEWSVLYFSAVIVHIQNFTYRCYEHKQVNDNYLLF